MQLSEKTVSLLRNFSGIQSNLAVKPGSSLMTLSEAKTIIGEVKVDETFPQEFGIYDLKEFLACYSLIENPSLEFHADHVTIYGRNSKMNYYFADLDLLTYPKKSVAMPDAEVTFTLKAETFAQIQKAATTLGHTQLVFEPTNGRLFAYVMDIKDKTANSFSIDLGEYQETDSFRFVFDVNNLKMMPGDYQVELSRRLISRFSSTTGNLTYIIAPEKDSKYEG